MQREREREKIVFWGVWGVLFCYPKRQQIDNLDAR